MKKQILKNTKPNSFRPPFSKGGGVEGQSPPSSSAEDETSLFKSAGGASNVPVGHLTAGNPRRGFLGVPKKHKKR